MTNKKARLIEALTYLRYCAKECGWEPEVIDGMTSEQVIKYAEDMMDYGEYLANQATL